MTSRLKVDLHLHTREGEPCITYDAYTLIDRAAREGYDVLSITNHDLCSFSERLVDYAADRGIVLIPGAEATIEGRHVLIYNFDVSLSMLRTFADLRRYKTPEWLVIAAHPFFPAQYSLGRRLLREIDVFDAIEFSHFFTRSIDFNRRAVELARATGLPLVGSSDSHLARQFGTTYSLVEGEPTVFAVLSAIRHKKVQVVSRPLTLPSLLRIGTEMKAREAWEQVRARPREAVSPSPSAEGGGGRGFRGRRERPVGQGDSDGDEVSKGERGCGFSVPGGDGPVDSAVLGGRPGLCEDHGIEPGSHRGRQHVQPGAEVH